MSVAIFQQHTGSRVHTLTGRVRGRVRRTGQLLNTQFQGLAGDGAKEALWRLMRAGYRVVGFVHDEFLIELPADLDNTQTAKEIERICCETMTGFTPGVKIAAEYTLADRWSKRAEHVTKDGKLCVWSPDGHDVNERTHEQTVVTPTANPVEEEKAAALPVREQRRPGHDPNSICSAPDPGPQPAAESTSEQVVTKKNSSTKREKTKRRRAETANRKLTPPLKWHGGKHYQAKHIIELMPEHTHYCEPFAGGLSVLLAKDPQGVAEAVNDLNGELMNFWQVLREPQQFNQFYRQLECTPLAQPLFDAAADCDGP